MTAPEPEGLWRLSRQDSRPIPEAYGGIRAGIRRGFNPVYLIRGSMGKLAFNPVPVVAEFIQRSGGHSAKTMRAYFILFKTHAAYGPAESVFSKRNGFGTIAGKDVLVAAGIRPQFFQNSRCLPAERDRMVASHFHAFRLAGNGVPSCRSQSGRGGRFFRGNQEKDARSMETTRQLPED